MKTPVRNKTDMYRRLAAGEFGSTTRQFFDLMEWLEYVTANPRGNNWWGVRTMTPGGPCVLNCEAIHVPPVVWAMEEAGHKVNISLMVDTVATVTAWLELWDSPTGLVVEGIEWPDTDGGWTWRNSMPDPTKRKRWEGVAARMVLARHLNENSLDDARDLIEAYPDHVIEMSALDRCVGVVPCRNGIVWEVRCY